VIADRAGILVRRPIVMCAAAAFAARPKEGDLGYANVVGKVMGALAIASFALDGFMNDALLHWKNFA